MNVWQILVNYVLYTALTGFTNSGGLKTETGPWPNKLNKTKPISNLLKRVYIFHSQQRWESINVVKHFIQFKGFLSWFLTYSDTGVQILCQIIFSLILFFLKKCTVVY
jgi:hypothetical protein